MKARPAPLFVCTLAVLVFTLGIGGTASARRRGWAAVSHGEQKAEPAGPLRSARALAEGRRHLKKANAFAGANKWWSAIKEYTIAFEKLADPVVLFNRADCYRRIGENDRAIADYRAFLKAFPKAPNRADVEAKIAALETLAGRPVATVPVKDTAKPEPPAKLEPARTEVVKTEASKTPKTEERTETAAREPEPPPVAPLPPPPIEVPLTPPEPAASAEPVLITPGSDPVVVARENKPQRRGYWWLWVLAGTVVAAGGTTAFLVLRPHPATIPTTDLGNYRF